MIDAQKIEHVLAFWLGMREFLYTFTTRHDSESLRDAYDRGREWAHRLTFRAYDAA